MGVVERDWAHNSTEYYYLQPVLVEYTAANVKRCEGLGLSRKNNTYGRVRGLPWEWMAVHRSCSG